MATVSFLGLDAKNQKQNPTFLLAVSLSLLSSPFGATMLSCYFPQWAMGHSGCRRHPPGSGAAGLALCHAPSLPAPQGPVEERPRWQELRLLSSLSGTSHWPEAVVCAEREGGHQLQFVIDCSLPSNVSKARNIFFLSSSTVWWRHVPCLFRSGNSELNSVICYRHNLNCVTSMQ